jgi:TolB-like protein/Tfp pilus assembly protein PilF
MASMTGESGRFRLQLLGPFGLFDATGQRIRIGKKAAALMALMATGRDGVRARSWLQDMLWGARGLEQAQASLRRELANLRPLLNPPGAAPLLVTTPEIAGLQLDRLELDLDGPRASLGADIFLEGIDIPGEEGFEDWLREQRAALEAKARREGPRRPADGMTGLPEGILKPHPPGEGFFGRPFLAVLRFVNLTGDPDNDYLAEGLAEDLIDRLSRLRWIPIIASAASFAHSTETATLHEIGQALGVRYIVEGRLRRRDGAPQLTASVSDAESGRALWTWRADLPADAPLRDPDVILTEVVAALASRIDDAEMTRAVSRPAGDPEVNDLIWRARWHHNRYTGDDSRIAEQLLQEALAREPNSPEAIVQLADFRQRQVWLNRAPAEEIVELRQLAQRAITADYLDARGYLIAGLAELWLGHNEAAISLFNQAIGLNPSLAYGYSQIGAALYLSGRPGPALDMLAKALRLNMGEQHAYYVLGEIAMCHAMLGQWDEAIRAADESIVRRPAYWYAHAAKIHALASRGEASAAERAYRVMVQAKRGFRPDFIDWVPFVGEAGTAWRAELKRTLEMLAAAWAEGEARQTGA